MKIQMDKEYELKLTAEAVEKIEENYDKSLEEIFEGKKLRSKDLTFVVWASMQEEIDINEAKKLFSKHYTYQEMIQILNELLGTNPNENGAAVTEIA